MCLWEAFKKYIKQLEVEKNSSKTMELLFEMLKKIENGILPSKNEVIYLNNEATTPRTGGNWKQKLDTSKIKLFCKFYEVLFCEKSGRFKFFELLEPNEKNYLKDFVNLEIACLEKVSGKTQNFIDEIDQIKKLSYSTIKKADFAFETEGKIFKYWTLNKNMVPEGEEYSLESQDCVFKTAPNEMNSNMNGLKVQQSLFPWSSAISSRTSLLSRILI